VSKDIGGKNERIKKESSPSVPKKKRKKKKKKKLWAKRTLTLGGVFFWKEEKRVKTGE